MYCERQADVDTIIHEVVSVKINSNLQRNNFHLADNDNLDKNDKYAKVRPFYDLANESLKQFGYWHNDYSIDEQMIPYFGMHSAKQTMREKSVRFRYKNSVLAGSDGYPYHIIPYSGAKGIGGTPGKDLTLCVDS